MRSKSCLPSGSFARKAPASVWVSSHSTPTAWSWAWMTWAAREIWGATHVVSVIRIGLPALSWSLPSAPFV